MANGYATLKQVRTVQLPHLSGAVGQLHTVIQDASGNLYCSDEFNHTVVSLDRQGELRWHKGGRGAGDASFCYPKGMAIGFIRLSEENFRTLAVCDSWNRRLQFFNLDGDYLCSWNHSGDQTFDEIADVRFAEDIEGTGGHGCWLILDRGAHRLRALRSDGSPVVEIGRTFPPHLEDSWSIAAPDGPDVSPQQERAVFDPLYYPARLLGRPECGLYIWEPLRSRLKRLLRGNLIGLPLCIPECGEWLAADAAGFLAWSRGTRQVSFWNADGELEDVAEITGTPVYSDLPSDEFWIQTAGLLRLHRHSARIGHDAKPRRGSSLLLRVAREGLGKSIRDSKVSSAVASLLECLESTETLSETLLNMARRGTLDLESLKTIQAEMGILRDGLRAASSALTVSLQPVVHSIGTVELIGRAFPCSGGSELVGWARQICNQLTTPIHSRFVAFQQRQDEISLHRWSLPLEESGKPDLHSLIRHALERQEEDLSEIMSELDRWCALPEALVQFSCLKTGTVDGSVNPLPIPFSAISRYRAPVQEHPFMREVDRIHLSSSNDPEPARPCAFAAGRSGDVYVTLHIGRRVAHLDSVGRVVDVIAASGAEILRRPTGMAVDDEGGLWIVEFRAHRLRYYDPVMGILEPADAAGSRAAGLYLPYGICRGANGQKVVADWGNHRVVAIERSGSIRVLCDSFGSEPGQLRHPIAVVPAHNGDGFWVVDQRNHRLQFMDADGAFVSQIGRCGPGKNELVLPEYVTPLPNGLLLVSQWRTRKEIKLFSLDGREQDRLAVDYAPSGMLVRGKFLWVADFQGSDVRVYELG